MKIYRYETPKIIRVRITKQKHGSCYINLVDTTVEEVIEFISKLVKDNVEVSPFDTGYKTRAEVREYINKKNGNPKSISFRGITPEELEQLIIKHLDESNN